MIKNINGYSFDEATKGKSGGAVFWHAKKGGSEYFLKCFDAPKRPSDRVSEAVRKQKNATCDEFAKQRKRVLATLRTLAGGNIIAPIEFFEYEKKFYQATLWTKIESKSLKEISAFDEKTKLLLLKTAANNLKILHDKGIIHLDLKPDNLPVSVASVSGRLVSALMDFDSSYFEDAMPSPEDTQVTDPYMSPELYCYKISNPAYGNKVTRKNDVFALAIVFHEYWTGRKFIFRNSDDIMNGRYLYQAVHEGEKIQMAPGVPKWLEYLLRMMIQKDPNKRPTMAQVLEILKNPEGFLAAISRKISPTPVPTPTPKPIPAPVTRTAPVPPTPVTRPTPTPTPVPTPPTRTTSAPSPFTRTATTPSAVGSAGYVKGPAFPSDAIDFKVLPNGMVKIISANSAQSLRFDVAVRKGYIVKA